ncbi:hypothetical protein [Amycolatopsis sp. H20-H5]|uniref:hypothetical protein n=1 Tax=Amycolatopsis sp. H20-H5 TaxID=3046309 RepID=UPI002DBD98FD|nr:hypothetical protein [Amycolatopsis sp. H20-H5]MEC3979912.1 hypothetical protein [Amycolatopsis sp. H20-H5]
MIEPCPEQPLFVVFAAAPDCATAFTAAVERDTTTTGGCTVARKRTARLLEFQCRGRLDAEQRARDLLGELTLELVGVSPPGDLSRLVGGGDQSFCGALPVHDGPERGFVFFGFTTPDLPTPT